MRVLGIMLLMALLMQGCGRKGPLYLPAPSISAQTTPDQPEQNRKP